VLDDRGEPRGGPLPSTILMRQGCSFLLLQARRVGIGAHVAISPRGQNRARAAPTR
jgi:hypothetical protein